jgi:hypothetical protein
MPFSVTQRPCAHVSVCVCVRACGCELCIPLANSLHLPHSHHLPHSPRPPPTVSFRIAPLHCAPSPLWASRVQRLDDDVAVIHRGLFLRRSSLHTSALTTRSHQPPTHAMCLHALSQRLPLTRARTHAHWHAEASALHARTALYTLDPNRRCRTASTCWPYWVVLCSIRWLPAQQLHITVSV